MQRLVIIVFASLKKGDAEFTSCAEDVLDIYEMPYNPEQQIVCMNENYSNFWVMQGLRFPCIPGADQKIDPEYIRNGTNGTPLLPTAGHPGPQPMQKKKN